MNHRSWFPAILIGLSLALAVFFIGVIKHREAGGGTGLFSSPDPLPEPAVAVTEEGYRASVNSVLENYSIKKDAKNAYNALILLRVPAADQTLHFDLVVAFGKLSSGQKEEGEARLAALKAENTWLSL
jgi:hypothetical protein